MTIGVYRIYLSAAWTGRRDLDALIGKLDQLPSLLYRIDRVAAEDIIGSLSDNDRTIGVLRIAMTQSHIAIVPVAGTSEPGPVESIERNLARYGFRRRIPVIGIALRCDHTTIDAASHGLDRVVPLETDAIAVALQELAEQAAAERRQATENLLGQPLRVVRPALANPSTSLAAKDGLPFSEIVAAFSRLQRARAVEPST